LELLRVLGPLIAFMLIPIWIPIISSAVSAVWGPGRRGDEDTERQLRVDAVRRGTSYPGDRPGPLGARTAGGRGNGNRQTGHGGAVHDRRRSPSTLDRHRPRLRGAHPGSLHDDRGQRNAHRRVPARGNILRSGTGMLGRDIHRSRAWHSHPLRGQAHGRSHRPGPRPGLPKLFAAFAATSRDHLQPAP